MRMLRYPEGRISGDYDYMEIGILEYQAPGLNRTNGRFSQIFNLPNGSQVNSQSRRVAQIILPMPLNIQDSNTVQWEQDTLNSLELAGFNILNDLIDSISGEGSIQDKVRNAQSLLTQSLGSAYTALDENTRNTIANALVGQAVNALGGNVNAQSLISRTTGQVLNPNMELLFRGVTLRSFDFNFEFTPRSQSESNQVREIIRIFKTEMSARSRSKGTTASNGLFICAPNIFQLQYKRGGRPHPFLNTFKPMGLKNISVNYTGTGRYATYEDATPVKMSMNLSFTELNPIYFEDYDNNVGGVGF